MIALVHGLRAYGAVERYVAAVARALVARGDDVAIVLPDAPVLAPLEGLGARVERFDLESGALAPRLVATLRRLRPSVVHVTELFPQALAAARLARVPRLLLTHHTPALPRRDSAVGRLWTRVGWLARPEVIYTSETDRARDGRTGLRTHVVPLGIDVDRFAGGTPALDLDGRVIGNVARLAAQKGHRYLIDAAPAVAERHPDARFVIVGDGELRTELERHATDRGVADRVLFTGARDDVPDLLASFDLFAFPSLYEGLCLAVIEAQAAGVPVVATPVGGIVETVADGVTGFLCPPADAAALADRICFCLDHPEEARRVADEARLRAARYAEERTVAETLALYDAMR